MTYQEKIRNYHRQASGDFKNAVGDEMQAVAQPMDLNDRDFTVQIALITTSVGGRARIFGANLGLDEAYNTANNVTVVIPESSHLFVKSQSMGNPFRIKGINYTVSIATQLANPFNIIQQTMSGSTTSKTWQPSKYTSPSDNKDKQIKTSELQDVIDGNKRIEIDFLATASASIVFTVSDAMDMSQALSNRTPIKSAFR